MTTAAATHVPMTQTNITKSTLMGWTVPSDGHIEQLGTSKQYTVREGDVVTLLLPPKTTPNEPGRDPVPSKHKELRINRRLVDPCWEYDREAIFHPK